MPLQDTVGGFFTHEWQRFQSGVRQLDPNVLEAVRFIEGQRGRAPGEATTITIPGWDSIIRLGPRTEVTREHWREFYAALRQERAPNLSAEVLAEIAWKQLVREANRTSAQPGWSQNWGQIMTAIDNVQDFMSTLATLGRLVLWAGAKFGLRAVPGLGWIILASDLLNLMNFFGLVAMPVYALLCDGPRAALAAGVPAAILKSALCREVWTMARRSPFGRLWRSIPGGSPVLGSLPTIGNLIEVAQTTDNLFGYGLSFGALYGTAMEGIFASTTDTPWSNTRINTDLFMHSMTGASRARYGGINPPGRQVLQQSARVLSSAPLIAAQADAFPDHVHQNHMAAMLAATAEVSRFMRHPDTREWLPAFFKNPLRAPRTVGRTAEAMFEGVGQADAGLGRWSIPGAPEVAMPEELIRAWQPQVTRAVTTYLKPRRNRQDATFYGAALNQLAEAQWLMVTGDPESLRWELSPDFKLLTGMATDGLLLVHTTPEGKAWRFWEAMRAELDRRGGKLLDAAKVRELAARCDVSLMKLLAPDAPLPMEWAPYFAQLGDAEAAKVVACPECGAPHG